MKPILSKISALTVLLLRLLISVSGCKEKKRAAAPALPPDKVLCGFCGAPIWLALLVAGTTITATSCKKAAPQRPPPPRVVVMEVAATNVPMEVEFIGQLDSPQNVEIRARVEGFVDQMLFVEGTNVNAGDPLFKLDDKPYQERLNAAVGMLNEAQASLKKYLADVARLTPLATNHAVPQQDLDNAMAAADVGRAAVISAEARVSAVRLDLSYCDIRAPVTGLIGAKQVSIGELVGKGQPTLMTTISTLDPIWFYCNVGEVQYRRAETELRRLGKSVWEMKVTLVLPDDPSRAPTGSFVFIDRAVDPKTGTLRVRAKFPNPDYLLRPGMFGRIKVHLGDRPDSILVPARAVTELQGKNFVWVVDSDNKASQRSVTVGQQIGENLLITENLKAGERIIVEGIQRASQDQPVQPMTVAEAAKPAETNPAKEGAAKHGKE